MARWATDTATAYAKIREQFGRPIGQFQAIKHKCAEMIADTERATAAVWDAARAIDESRQSDSEDSAFEFAAAVAATLAPVAAQRCTQDCIQVHGGIGFTWEHDTNVYYRRALVLAACFGRAADYPQQVVDLATDTGMRKLNIDLDPETEKLREEIRAEVAGLKAIPRDERNTAIAEGGWVQPHLPKPWGRASNPVEQIIIAQEFSSGRVKRPQMGIASWIIPSIVAFGTDDQQQRFLPPTFRGEMIWCQLFSEPGAGSDLAGLSTKATKVEGGWRITGQKIWTTAAQYSQWGALLARTDPSAPKHNGITYFLLDMKSEGVEVKPLRELTGNAMFNTVFIDDVFVPDEYVLGEVNRGWEVSRNTLTAERVSIGSSEPPGMASLDGFVEFIRDGQFDQIGQNQAGRLIAEGHAAKVLNMRSTLLTLAGGDPMPAAAISKLLSMRTGQGYSEFAVSSFGTDGAIGDPEQLPGQMGRVSAVQPGHHHLRWHDGGAAQHHRRAAVGPAPRPVSTDLRRHSGSTIEIGRHPKWLAVVMRDLPRRILRLMVTGSAAASFLIAAPALLGQSGTEHVAQPGPCVNGVIPWNPFVVNCNLPPRGPRIRGAAPDAGAIIACRDHPGCLSWYVNGPW